MKRIKNLLIISILTGFILSLSSFVLNKKIEIMSKKDEYRINVIQIAAHSDVDNDTLSIRLLDADGNAFYHDVVKSSYYKQKFLFDVSDDALNDRLTVEVYSMKSHTTEVSTFVPMEVLK